MNYKKNRKPFIKNFLIFVVIVIATLLISGLLGYSILLPSLGLPFEYASVIVDIMSALFAAIAAYLVLVEIRGAEAEYIRQSKIDEAIFLLQYNQAFIQDTNMTEVEHLLEDVAFYGRQEPIITSENRQKFVNYLVYLEGFAPLILGEFLTLDHADDLMTYRFYLAMHNREVQEKHLVEFPAYYSGCFKLYKMWTEYKEINRLPIPLQENSLYNWVGFSTYSSDKNSKNHITKQLTENELLSNQQYKEIAGLIYDTDKYISPALFAGEGNPRENAVTILSYVLKLGKDVIFCKENLFIYSIQSKIIGMILWKKGRLAWDNNKYMSVAGELGINLNENNVKAVKEHFFEEKCANNNQNIENMISIISVCVSQDSRKRGIGNILMRNFIDQHQATMMELFVLCENNQAINLYKEHGFEIVSESPGFSLADDKPLCYKMLRKF